MAMGHGTLVPRENPKIAGKLMFISLYVVTHPLFASYTTNRCPLKRSLTGALLTEKSTKVPQETAAVIS